MDPTILDTIGTSIIPILSPVSITMSLVVLLITTTFSPNPTTSSPTTAANLVYQETPSDTVMQKLQGSFLNALVFILVITVITFLLVILYYYKWTGFLKNYMRFSACMVFVTMAGPIGISYIEKFWVPIDVFTCMILLWNFMVMGVVSVGGSGPILVRQGYMVVLGVVVAAWFTKLPEWTTWGLLMGLAVYDLVAVLVPGGPLRVLVELAESREDNELPALVYEVRPVVGGSGSGSGRGRGRGGALGIEMLVAGVSSDDAVEMQPVTRDSEGRVSRNSNYSHVEMGNSQDESEQMEEDDETSPFVSSPYPRPSASSMTSEIVEEHRSTPVPTSAQEQRRSTSSNHDDGMSIPGIKLGMGDFVFYSVLVGRAAMYDLMTVYACYLAVISGLGCTLMLLSVYKRALPALPISIALGVTFYFLTRLLMEPFVVGLSTNLTMF